MTERGKSIAFALAPRNAFPYRTPRAQSPEELRALRISFTRGTRQP